METREVESLEGQAADPYLQLAGFLRSHPEAVRDTPEQLAEKTGLPLSLVQPLLGPVPGASRQRQPGGSGLKDARWSLGLPGLRSTWERACARPLLFLAITIAASMLMLVAVAPQFPSLRIGTSSASVSLGMWMSASFICLVVLSHMLLYVRNGRARLALWGGLMGWASATAVGSIQLLIGGTDPGRSAPLSMGLLAAGYAVLALAYVGAGVLMCVLGGYLRVRRTDEGRRNLGRHELLQRLFEIEERLTKSDTKLAPTEFMDRPLVATIRRNSILVAVIAGAVLSAGQMGLLSVIGIPTPTSENEHRILFGLVGMGTGLFGTLTQILVCFLAGSVLRSVWTSLVYAGAATLIGLIPVGVGPTLLRGEWPWGFLIALGAAALIGAVSGLGATIEHRAARDRRLARDDPAALVSEMIQIQHQLDPQTSEQCVMVVDIAKSSVMKAQADPFVAEWSFREYHLFVEKIVNGYGGKIHSTQGDGAIAVFRDPLRAFRAAKQIQTDMATFNTLTNRLASPFRARIGLHQGTVIGDVDAIQFTEVIDVAAHVERVSQVGGIALSEPVAAHLTGEPLAELRDHVDGYKVFLALNPLIDP